MRTSLLVLVLVCSACIRTPAALTADQVATLVGSSDRSADDRALDPGRKPAEFLAFTRVGPGMTVGELMAGGGYTTELLSRSVGPSGVVYGENPKWVLERFAEKPWTERLTKLSNVKRADLELDAPFPTPESDGKLDVVVSNAIYHDAVWNKVDREKMNRAVYRALKMGGSYVVCDSSAQAGAGDSVAESLHRIEESFVRAEVEKAGFKFATSGDFLRNPADTRDWNASPRAAGEKRGTSDRFCLRFERPTAYY
ncbi:MAG: SAM-dependent methyltransferase [Archangium sp.]